MIIHTLVNPLTSISILRVPHMDLLNTMMINISTILVHRIIWIDNIGGTSTITIISVVYNMRTAKRAIGVVPEPRVDTWDVKSVATLWQQPESLVLSKLVQTNRAFRPFDQPFASSVLYDRYGVNDRLLQSHSSDEPDGMIDGATVLARELPVIMIPTVWLRIIILELVGAVVSPLAEAEAGLGDDEVVAEEKGEGGEESDEDDDGRGNAVSLVGLVGDGER